MKTVNPEQKTKVPKSLEKIAIKAGVAAAKEKLRLAKEDVAAAKRELKCAKALAAAVNVEETTAAIREARKNLKVAKLSLKFTKLLAVASANEEATAAAIKEAEDNLNAAKLELKNAKKPADYANTKKALAAVKEAKKNLEIAKREYRIAKKPILMVDPQESGVAVKGAKKKLEIAKQDVVVAKLNIRRAKKPGQILKDGIIKRFWKTKFLFLLFLPALIYYIVFKYVPMWGISISFFDRYSMVSGLARSKFVGFQNFEAFFRSPDCWQLTWNTLALSLQGLFIGFPITVLFSLLLNEVRNQRFKKITQTISYMPHFLSVVIVCSLVKSLTDIESGAINSIIKAFGGEPIYFMMEEKWFRPLFLISGIWQGLGWGTIVYLAAISSVDPGLYEAARLDGAGRWRQMWSITLPTIAPTVVTMFILQIGHVMDSSLDKVLLLQSSGNSRVASTISTYVFSQGVMSATSQAMATAVGLYSSLINLALLMIANFVSKKVTETGVF